MKNTNEKNGSILELKKEFPALFIAYEDWYKKEEFAKERGKASCPSISIVPESVYKTWEQQQTLLGKDDEVPTAQEVVAAIIKTGIGKSPISFYVRTSSISAGNHVYVGIVSGKISIYDGYDDCIANVGVVKKSEPQK